MTGFLQEGDVIEINSTHRIYAEVPKHFVYSNCKGDFTLTESDVQACGEFDYLQGRYVVIKTEMSGGGTGHGPHDIYPDGHKVTCQHIDTHRTISFYQSGCFTAMITDIKPVAKATLTWSVQ